MTNRYDITQEVMYALQNYSNDLVNRVNISSEKCAKELCSELKETSPKKTGNYKKGWRVRQVCKTHTLSQYVVHNATDYQLTHLLEYGHAINGGTERVKSFPHIVPATEKAVNKFVDEVEKAVQEAGK